MTADRPTWAPEPIDLDRPNGARVYDYLLDGSANFSNDRAFANQLLEVMPEAREAARRNRAFLRRAVRHCVANGIQQFLDVGAGIPTAGNVHEIAPDARVLYVDNDPIAVLHSDLMLRDNDRVAVLRADLTDPATVLEAAERHLDLAEPVAVLVVSVLHHVPDAAEPHAAVAEYVRAVVPGSYLVLAHGVAAPELPGRYEAIRLFQSANTPGKGRTRADIERFFTGLDLVEPGLVWTHQWRPDTAAEPDPETSVVIAGVGRKPRRSPVGA